MVRLELSLELNYEIADNWCDFILNIHAAHTPRQRVIAETLKLSQPVLPELYTEAATANRYARVQALTGDFKINYSATVELTHHFAQPAEIAEVAVARLPPEALKFLYPSRYCQSDRLHELAIREFGHLWQGYSRVQAIRDWVNQHVTYSQNTSNSNTSAVDTLVEQVGVCRDFAHLMIALCRAVNIPARFVTGIDYGADLSRSPTDFHAYVEVFLGDRWYLFDPAGTAIPMGFVRLGTGRDAADVSFAMIFGSVYSSTPILQIEAVADQAHGYVIPHHCAEAISTDGSYS